MPGRSQAVQTTTWASRQMRKAFAGPILPKCTRPEIAAARVPPRFGRWGVYGQRWTAARGEPPAAHTWISMVDVAAEDPLAGIGEPVSGLIDRAQKLLDLEPARALEQAERALQQSAARRGLHSPPASCVCWRGHVSRSVAMRMPLRL